MARAKTLRMPPSVANDEYRKKKWREIVKGRNFTAKDIPALTLLVQWYQIVDTCIEQMSFEDGSGIQIVFPNKLGDIKPLPHIAVMAKASAEIRALNKQLGINDTNEESEAPEVKNGGDNYLTVIQGRKQARKAAAEA